MDRALAPKEYFYLSDGRFLTNTNDLISALKTMSDDTFMHHVSDQRNDFASWLRDVFENEALAKKISNIKDKEKMRKEIQYELTRHHARKFLQSANYFAKTQEVKEGKKESEKAAEQQNPALIKKVDEMLKREQDIREQEEVIKNKIEAQKRIATHDFLHGLLTGIVISAFILLIYMLVR